MKIIALCFSTPGMAQGAWRDHDYGKRYPGAGWMRHLAHHGHTVVSGHTAVGLVQSGEVKPGDVHIIQEDANPDGVLLQEMGCSRTVIMCLESPIYAAKFYDHRDHHSRDFKHKLFFDGGTEHLYFPSFDDEDIHSPVPWDKRKLLCMVTANKHYGRIGDTMNGSPTFKRAMETQLHDYRYEAIKYFLGKPGFDLFGRGWPVSTALECGDKIATIRNYKFALCFENGAYPGYVTEKIIDCLVAGVIPVYMGAPDVINYVPDDLFTDARDYRRSEIPLGIEEDISWVDPRTCQKLINKGIDWLKSPDGRRYNNRVFAARILEMCDAD